MSSCILQTDLVENVKSYLPAVSQAKVNYDSLKPEVSQLQLGATVLVNLFCFALSLQAPKLSWSMQRVSSKHDVTTIFGVLGHSYRPNL